MAARMLAKAKNEITKRRKVVTKFSLKNRLRILSAGSKEEIRSYGIKERKISIFRIGLQVVAVKAPGFGDNSKYSKYSGPVQIQEFGIRGEVVISKHKAQREGAARGHTKGKGVKYA